MRRPHRIIPPLVAVDGQRLDAERVSMLSEVVVDRPVNRPALCELRFEQAHGREHPFDAIPGAALEVSVGETAETLFEGDITAIEQVYGSGGLQQLRVRAFDRLHRLRQRQPVRLHLDLDLVDLVTELVSPDGIEVSSNVSSPVSGRVYQFRQTDFDLLAERAAACGAHFALHGQDLELFDLGGCDDEIELALGDDLFEARFEDDADHAAKRVQTRGWDPTRVESIDGSADTPRAARDDLPDPPAAFGSTFDWQLLDEVVRAEAEAEGLAQAELDYRVARRMVFSGSAAGNVGLRPGGRVRVSGVAPQFSGRYVLTRVRHSIDSTSGFLSSLWTAPPEPAKRQWAAMMTFGRVTRVEDPQALGRVQVDLVAYGSMESPWLQVLLPAAGADKGLIALPDVGDTVLVLYSRQDPSQGVVLGGLYGSTAPPDAGVEGNAVRRFTMLTPGGQRIFLDDEENWLRLENSRGSFVELKPDVVRLHAEADVEIEAPGKRIVISGSRIDFQES